MVSAKPAPFHRSPRPVRVALVPRTQKEWIRLLTQDGWTQETGGKHGVKMTKEGHRPITLPTHKRSTYANGLDAAIKREAGL